MVITLRTSSMLVVEHASPRLLVIKHASPRLSTVPDPVLIIFTKLWVPQNQAYLIHMIM